MTAPKSYPESLISSLGLVEENCRLTVETIEKFQLRELAFEWLHLGLLPIEIGKVLAVIEQDKIMFPPRTGHIGNWDGILSGHAGALDFNYLSISNNRGYPLLYCFNQTESADGSTGDTVYKPASIYRNEEHVPLELFVWSGSDFTPCNKDKSYFTPFVFLKRNDEFISLINFHVENLSQREYFNFRLEPDLLYENRSKVRQILIVLIKNASKQRNSKRAMSEIFSHQVSLNGEMIRVTIEETNGGFLMGSMRYDSAEDIADASLIVLEAVSRPVLFKEKIKSLPSFFPMISNTLSRILSAIFSSHFPLGHSNNHTTPFNPHFHWGARDMAGYPPLKNGYFSNKSKLKATRDMFNVIIKEIIDINPVLFVIFPSSIFLLSMPLRYDRDLMLIEELLNDVIEVENQEDPKRIYILIKKMVTVWLSSNRKELSSYFINKFKPSSGFQADSDIYFQKDTLSEPANFRKLTFQRACMIVSALFEEISSESK